jgi:hypothetical protein
VCTAKWCKELKEMLELEHLDLNPRYGELNQLQLQYTQITQHCTELKTQLNPSRSLLNAYTPPITNGNIHLQSETTSDNDTASKIRVDNLIEPVCKSNPKSILPNQETAVLIAAARNDDQSKDQEFRLAER